MRWTRGERSQNLEDRRAASPGRMGLPGGGGMRLGLGGMLLVLGIGWALGLDPLTLLGALSGGGGTGLDVPMGSPDVSAQGALQSSPEEEERVDFVSFVLDDTQQTWSR